MECRASRLVDGENAESVTYFLEIFDPETQTVYFESVYFPDVRVESPVRAQKISSTYIYPGDGLPPVPGKNDDFAGAEAFFRGDPLTMRPSRLSDAFSSAAIFLQEFGKELCDVAPLGVAYIGPGLLSTQYFSGYAEAPSRGRRRSSAL